MKQIITASAIALLASVSMASAQSPMSSSGMSQKQMDEKARTESRPEIKNSETKPPTATTVGRSGGDASGTKSNPAEQSLNNAGSGGSGGGR